MRIQVLFNETSVLVPCGDGQLTVRELVDKAIVRYKKVLSKHSEDEIDVTSVRLADSGSFVAFDDEVADVLEDKEVIVLDFKCLNDDNINDDDDTSHALPRDTPINSSHTLTRDTPINSTQTYSNSHLTEGESTRFTSDLDTPYITSIMPELEDTYASGPALTSGRSSSQELHHRLDDMDNGMVGSVTMGTTLRGMGISDGDLGLSNQQAWQSQNSNSQSQDPSSPHLGRKPEWRGEVDTGYVTTQDSGGFSQSQPKSQEFQGGSSSQPMATDPLSYTSHTDGVVGVADGVDGMSGVGSAGPMSYNSSRKVSGDRASLSGQNYSTSSLNRDLRGSGLTTSRKEDSTGIAIKSSLKNTSTTGYDHTHSFSPQSHDGFSPAHSHGLPHTASLPGAMDHMGGRMFDPMGAGGGRGFVNYMPSLDESGTFDRNHMMEQYKRRSMSSYGQDNYPRGHYNTPPQGMGGMNFRPPYSDKYGDQRSGPQGRFGHHHDPYYGPNSRMSHSFSHERVDMAMGGMRPHPSFLNRPGMEEEFSNSQGVAMEMYLSQPTTGNFFPMDRMSGPGYNLNPMMGGASGPPGYGSDPRFAMANPHGVSLSQPGVMMSHRGGFGGSGMDRHMLHPQNSIGGLSDRMSDKVRANSIKSLDSLERREIPTLSIDEFDLDTEDEDNTTSSQKGRNPFQRDMRKSMFRDGSLYSQWMDRMYENDLQDNEDSTDIPTFEGDSASQAGGDNATATAAVANTSTTSNQSQGSKDASALGAESGEESGEEDDEYGNIHIVELHKKDEPLGIQLTHFTSAKGVDLGVYIASMAEGQFAAKSGSLQVMDRILACNGCDFTKSMSSVEVEEVFSKMVHEPLLRMAVSRGGFKSTLQKSTELDSSSKKGDVGGASVDVGVAIGGDGAAADRGIGVGVTADKGVEPEAPVGVIIKGVETEAKAEETSERPSIRTVVPSAAPPQAASLTLTNTRQIGVKHRISLKRSGRGYGLGLTSRDVHTDQKGQPVYVKSIHQGSAAYQDGRLRIGDRILEVNGVSVVEMRRPEVVQLLREATECVDLVISRQEVIEEQTSIEDEAPPTSSEEQECPRTVNKTVLSLSMSLHNSGPAGLGVTVYTKSTGKSGEEMGVFIKSIVPGGAAAMDSRLQKNDQVLSVNDCSLLGLSNLEAMDMLKTALTNTDTVNLTVARKTLNATPSMAALGEEPEEEEPESGGNEVGIDVPVSIKMAATSSSASHHRSTSATIKHVRSASGVGSPSVNERSHRARSATVSSTSSPSRSRSGRSESPSMKTTLCRSQDLLGSGDELYDKLEPLPDSAPSNPSRNHTSAMLMDQAAAMSYLSSSTGQRDSISNLDNLDMTSLDVRGMSRSSSTVRSFQPHPPLMSRDPTPSAGDLPPTGPRRKPVSTSSGASSSSSSHLWNYSSQVPDHSAALSMADGDQQVGRMDAPVRGSGRRDRNKPERGSGRGHASGGASSLTSLSPDPSMMNGFATMPRLSSSSYHSDAGGHVLAHSTSVTLETASHGSHGSLENLRLSDSEVNDAFRRDNPGRISITKKTKRNPRQDLAHLRYIDSMPLIEGEKPTLVRAGSDGFLNEHVDADSDDIIQNMAVGPSLGLVKSSSLESLHNVMHHHIIRDMVDDGPGGNSRARVVRRNSFKRNTISHYREQDVGGQEAQGEDDDEQRGVDVDFGLNEAGGSSAMISFTKSVHGSKSKKKGFFEKVFRKRKTTKKSKTSPETGSRLAKGMSMEISPASLTAEERDQLMKHYTLQLRPHASTLPHTAGARQRTNTMGGRISPSVSPAPRAEASGPSPTDRKFDSLPNRFSMPMLDDYDSPGSPDEQILATVAKV